MSLIDQVRKSVITRIADILKLTSRSIVRFIVAVWVFIGSAFIVGKAAGIIGGRYTDLNDGLSGNLLIVTLILFVVIQQKILRPLYNKFGMGTKVETKELIDIEIDKLEKGL